MSVVLAALLAGTIIPAVDLPPTGVDPCAAFDRPELHSGDRRTITAADLVAMADIGRSDPNESESPFSISPDGTKIAFLVRRGNARENDYCQRLMLAPMNGGGEAIELDRGGGFIRVDTDLRKFVSIMRGTAKVIVPRWSPDGRTIAFLKSSGGSHQVWLVRSDGNGEAKPATNMPDNVDDFDWTADGEALVLATRPAIRLQAEAIAREARNGFLFDDRIAPQIADRPIPIEPVATEYDTVEIQTGKTRRSNSAERALLKPEQPQGVPENAREFARSPRNGMAAWREPIHRRQLLSPTGVTLVLPDGRKLECQEQCRGARQIWWSADGGTLYALQRTGWGESRTALLRWQIGQTEPRPVMVTDDVLVGCKPVGGELVCAREGATRPRALVAIDPENGSERLIHDPNPSFRDIALASPERLEFRNAFGVESYADLLLPPHHRSGEKHPLVVVQYHSHGFLRGGTGDEFPIQLLAARGFAVLSFARPDFVPRTMAAETELDMRTTNRTGWTDRRNVHSSLQLAIERAIATGSVDRDRIGISGFSDGMSTVQWALVNSSLFAVAAIGTCCEGFGSYPLAAGPAFTQFGRDMGYRFFEPGAEDYWKPMSLTLNMDRIETPILIQASDSEYEGGLDVVENFRHRGKAIELYVMEGEPHLKYQPAHRQAMYERSTEWFQFWLMGMLNCDPAKTGQYARWKAMKGAPSLQQLRCESGSSAIP